jgi:gas vesicle protein
MVEFSIEQLDSYMQNIGEKQFSYDTFKAAYDTDPRIQELVTDFNDETISLKDSEMDDIKRKRKKSTDDVSKMAKRATKVGDI